MTNEGKNNSLTSISSSTSNYTIDEEPIDNIGEIPLATTAGLKKVAQTIKCDKSPGLDSMPLIVVKILVKQFLTVVDTVTMNMLR